MQAVRSENEIKIIDGYYYRESIKDIPGKRFDYESKAWFVPLTEGNAALLQLIGAELDSEVRGLLAVKDKNSGNQQACCPVPVKASLYQHQVRAFNYALSLYEKSKGVALLCDMGTGKTITTISIASVLFKQGKIKRVLVVCPKSITGVWEEEFAKFAAYDYTLAVLDGDGFKKADTLRHLNGAALQIAVVNYESCWRLEKYENDAISKWSPDLIICDESSKIKNPKAEQSRHLHKLGKAAKYTTILTGTPITNNPLDFFSQYKFLDDKIFGASFFTFRNRYAISGGYGNHQVVGYRHMAELVTKAHSVAFRVKLEDAVDLPPFIDETRLLQLEPKAKAIYDAIDRDSYAQLMSGEVCTRNILTRLLRLSQITGGFIRDDGAGLVQQISRAKLEALDDILDTCLDEGKKVVIFARFVPEIEAIEKLIKGKKIGEGKDKKPVGYSLIKGDVKDRAGQVERFQNDPDIKVFIGQIQTTGMGLTLTAASVAVYYSLDFSYANYQQSRARIHRIGQKQKCLYIHLIAKNTVDEKIMAALNHKGDIAKLMVDEYKQLLPGGN